MILSKSNFILYLQHPAWLWLEKNDKSKLPPIDEDTQALFDAGNLFESYAEKIFPAGKTLGYKTNGEFDGNLYNSLPKRTNDAIASGEKILFQGRFENDGLTFIFDVLERNENGTYNLYEIKSTTEVKKLHEYDLAFQTLVAEKSGLKINEIYVIHVNNEYVRTGEIDNKQITAKTNVTFKVKGLIDEVAIEVENAKEVMTKKEMPSASLRHFKLGKANDWIVIYKNLNPNLDKYSIYNLCAPGAKRIGVFEDEGIETISEIPDDAKLTAKQVLQVAVTKSGEREIDKEKIKEFLNSFKFPLYFLDYETMSGVIPAFDGLRPYQQVPFQYSLHKLESPDAKLEHTEYLHKENTLPLENLLERLNSEIGPEGTILVWYESFEKTRNDEMALMMPKYQNFLYDVNNRIVDLMIPFSQGWFSDKDCFGSASIKAVMPVLIPELSYKDLNVQGGNAAQRIWMRTIINGKNKEKKDEIMEDLIKYCTLDTLAMVEIWRVLKDL